VADYIGDSFYLSKLAAGLDCKTLVFAGVRFMAESAKLLSPEKRVLMPEPKADCPMAHMVVKEDGRTTLVPSTETTSLLPAM
jgi:quinolinate synthase